MILPFVRELLAERADDLGLGGRGHRRHPSGGQRGHRRPLTHAAQQLHIVSKAFEAPPGKQVKAAIKETAAKMANVGAD